MIPAAAIVTLPAIQYIRDARFQVFQNFKISKP